MSTPFDPLPGADRLDPSVQIGIEMDAASRVPVVLAITAYDAFQCLNGLAALEQFCAERGESNIVAQLHTLQRYIADQAGFTPRMKQMLAGNRRALGLAQLP